jgi:hypothetical protein
MNEMKQPNQITELILANTDNLTSFCLSLGKNQYAILQMYLILQKGRVKQKNFTRKRKCVVCTISQAGRFYWPFYI